NTKIIEMNDPARGDVMVFRFPQDNKTNYIKRVVGLPGDVVRYQDKVLYINGERVEDKLVENRAPFVTFEEQLGEVSHRIIKTSGTRPGAGEGEWTVPAGHYFVMGDNRDNSNDSRYWQFVPDENIVGKAFAIWMHWKPL